MNLSPINTFNSVVFDKGYNNTHIIFFFDNNKKLSARLTLTDKEFEILKRKFQEVK